MTLAMSQFANKQDYLQAKVEELEKKIATLEEFRRCVMFAVNNGRITNSAIDGDFIGAIISKDEEIGDE